MFNIGGMELLVILAVALLVLGPDKLPKFMRILGKALGDLRRASTDFQRTINTDIDPGILEDKQEPAAEEPPAVPLPPEAVHAERRKMARPRASAGPPRRARKKATPLRKPGNNTENV